MRRIIFYAQKPLQSLFFLTAWSLKYKAIRNNIILNLKNYFGLWWHFNWCFAKISFELIDKVKTLWEGHKIWKKSPTCFDVHSVMSKQVEDFLKFLWPFKKTWTLTTQFHNFFQAASSKQRWFKVWFQSSKLVVNRIPKLTTVGLHN